ncbi:dTDP-4-amino-4,6-dideoxygalactose transaminase [Actinopolymorpha cephalotaxi]|uniref:dTDP-4-amino-4,6-dideoxygalactose transaminase n=2 Tax=Actinopolymorpha cephalotaxi TaxID=504797 RepID=A0A1I2USZ5_9ACTN|nr:DegT/DnrJ/EryC1/StrS family aminotransferase [Actinopolymorpha cephalotaxi]NYH86695.1 dTDP-4-amino-4,6-dideoxygalactose transaminase [Actinopolymorpha cephalotaxi]SFG79399.1 dTDP-4-amino-4,6-dideoxygalactose transaminase [Actinopolymorpha cephalotaxi]
MTATRPTTDADRPALLGGSPVRTNGFPAWPPANDAAVRAVTEVAKAGVWSSVDGPVKTEFERAFADHHGARHGLAVCNGTIALEIALKALGIGSGDEVIVPGYTFLATATAVLGVNALPVFADVDPEYVCLDPDAVEAAITPRTKAIIPVHLAGHPADLDRLTDLAVKHGLALIEDAAHAHGARWRGRGVGSFGTFGCWSFQASKNMTAGEGGMVVTSDDELADRAWSFHHCGRSRAGAWYDHGILGGNYRLTEFQSAILLAQLADLDEQVARREHSARILDEGLSRIDGLSPLARDPRCTTHGYHLYQFLYDPQAFGGLPRERFTAALNAEGIPCSPGYGVPLDRQGVFAQRRFDQRATGFDPAYAATDYGRLDLPETERFCADLVWIPQQVLLGSDADQADIVTAAEKLSAAAGTLVEAT